MQSGSTTDVTRSNSGSAAESAGGDLVEEDAAVVDLDRALITG